MAAGKFTSIIKAIYEEWILDPYMGVPLYYGRADENAVKTFPRASYQMVMPSAPSFGYDNSKFINEYTVQFDIYDTDPDACGLLLEGLVENYHRITLPLDTGDNCSSLYRGHDVIIDPKLAGDTSPVYHGWALFEFRVDA